MAEFALGMGSNLGDRLENLTEAVRYILTRPGMGRFRLSGIYETEPGEGVGGDNFYNCVMVGNFYGSSEELQCSCREAEILLGSRIEKNNSSRTIDIDLLFFGDETRSGPKLILPHPGIGRRRFVLEPLAEVWVEKVPGLGATAEELLNECGEGGGAELVLEKPDSGCFWEVRN
ncbi:MAG: hypothetical protein AVO35_03555 [Candidatus Aegiribacteria sp. MLS_C]|nr:MAG: hypothetical protein AVO35_03555 [Candidatus Aegiribacteria sp. MLS_C]